MTRPATDPTGRLADLRAALADPRLKTLTLGHTPTEGEARAAFRLAVALGNCRQFGLDAGPLEGTLPPAVAVAAAAHVVCEMPTWVADAGKLGDEWDAALDPLIGERLVDDWLALRTDLWVAQVAIWEADEALREDADPDAPTVTTAVAAVPKADVLDAVLKEHREILGTQVDSTRLANWRAMLTEPHRDALPWWLDPTYYGVTVPSERADAGSPIPAAGVEYASTASTPGGTVGLGRTLAWESPHGDLVAELMLPAAISLEDDQADRPVNLTRTADDEPATHLAGSEVRFGTAATSFTVSLTAQVKVQLGWLRAVGPLDVLLVNGERWLRRESAE